ncbi:flagellar filament capping protein FliD [Pseudomonas sp. GD03944]|uniref:flagellar filament capping protein FliD n=1 Tax=Pseudomonas sp. GD03944 TaxID=2975409 RepID=UPI00244D3AF1|nr:flagellar filament capping protein FliD [Pseudomonas sp. GD03944]MDH1261752.1 flagellar filament capping protein FliD [Pseudomonas sp. GD03944]
MVGILGLGGSNIPTDTIIAALIDAERAPKTKQLDRLETATTAKFTGLGQLRGALSTFKTAVDELNKASLFDARTASSSNSSLLKVTGSATAPAGVYDVQVKQLASGSKVALQAVQGGADAKFNSGTMTISTGSTSIDVDITSSNNTLAGMRDAINAAGKDSGISATIQTNAAGSRLVLTSTKSGDGNDIKVAVTEDGVTTGPNALTTQAFAPVADPDKPGVFLPPSPTGTSAGVITTAKSAKLTVDGFELVRTSNTITDAIEGVTLNLAGTQSSTDLADGKTLTVTVGVDKSGVKGSIEKFVNAYNALITKAAELTAVADMGEGNAPATAALVGDSTVRSVLASLRNEMVAMTGDGTIKALANLGISSKFSPNDKSGTNGTLIIDSDQLNEALEKNFDELAGYLTGDNGLMGRLSKTADGYSKSGGVIEQRTDSLQGTLNSIDDQREALALRIERLQDRLVKQYTAMESLVASLNRTGGALETALANLPGSVKKD